MDPSKAGFNALKSAATQVWQKNSLDRLLDGIEGRAEWPRLSRKERRQLLVALHTPEVLGALTDQTDEQTAALAALLMATVLAPERTEAEAKTMAEILVTQYPGSLDPAKAVGLLAYGQRQIKSELTAKHGAGEGARSATGGSWAKAFVAAQFDSDDPPLVNVDLVAEVYTETRFDWRSELENSVTRLRVALAAAGEDTSAFDALDWCDSYSGIRASLCELQSRYRKAVVRQAGALDDHAHHKVEVIKRECDNPNFGVCLPIIGEWGSGRTRLLVELARTHYRRGQWPILLGPGDEAVIDRLLDRASTLFGFAINEVRELADAINAVDKDVLICIDDVDRLSLDPPMN